MRATFRRYQWHALLTSLVLVPACSSPDEKVELATRAARSWEATVRQTSTALERGAVPLGYARQILRAAIDHERAERRRPEWNRVPAEVRGGLGEAVDQLRSSLGPRHSASHE
jgi:hypothetical protein